MPKKKKFDVVLLSNPPAPHLNEIFKEIPKIFIPFFDSILLDYYLYYFKHYNLLNVFIIFYELEKEIVDYYLGLWFPENFLLDMRLNIFREERILGNVGAIKEIEQYIETDNIVVFNTGSFPKFDVRKAVSYHIKNNNKVTIITSKEVNNSDKIPQSYCFIMKKELLKYVPKLKYTDFKNQFISILKENNLKYDFYTIDSGLYPLITFEDYIDIIKECIVNPEEYMKPILNDFILSPKEESAFHKKAFSKAAKTEGCVIGRSSILQKGSIVIDSIISDNVVVGERAVVERSFIKPSTLIEDDSFIIENVDSINLKPLIDSPKIEDKPWERFFDLLLLFISLPVTIPLMIILSILVLIFDGWPIFYIQERLGKNGKPFKMIKFRTMRKDADKFKEKIKNMNEIDGPMFKITDDPRITKFGKFLRKTSLDELPQLWNILKGEMSFVGPRPLEEKEMSLHPQWRDLRLKVRPGLTGLWQVMKSKNESFSEWIEYDTYYITHKSPYLYFKILFLTLLSVLKRKNK